MTILAVTILAVAILAMAILGVAVDEEVATLNALLLSNDTNREDVTISETTSPNKGVMMKVDVLNQRMIEVRKNLEVPLGKATKTQVGMSKVIHSKYAWEDCKRA